MSKEYKDRDAEGTPNDTVRASDNENTSAEPGNPEANDGSGEHGESPGMDVPVEQVERLQEEVASLKDQLLRKQADFENFRKRMARERAEAAKFSNTSLLMDLVEVIDNFERAIKSAEDSRDFEAFHEGVALIEKQFVSMLDNKWGLKRYESAGEEFDPEKHQAIAAEESEEVNNQTVAEDYQKGFLLHDRVLRPAKVKVYLPANESGSPAEANVKNNE